MRRISFAALATALCGVLGVAMSSAGDGTLPPAEIAVESVLLTILEQV